MEYAINSIDRYRYRSQLYELYILMPSVNCKIQIKILKMTPKS